MISFLHNSIDLIMIDDNILHFWQRTHQSHLSYSPKYFRIDFYTLSFKYFILYNIHTLLKEIGNNHGTICSTKDGNFFLTRFQNYIIE